MRMMGMIIANAALRMCLSSQALEAWLEGSRPVCLATALQHSVASPAQGSMTTCRDLCLLQTSVKLACSNCVCSLAGTCQLCPNKDSVYMSL